MKATLDHVGIAVRDLPAALAFYRDALGLEVEAAEDVAAQHVRAHFIPAGASALELLEGTAPDSPIAKFIEKRGPGLHHITLRVDDIAAALVHVKARGVRLIDETARPGAEGALVAFIHPSSAHGVLVELKQARAAAPRTPYVARIARRTLGDLELISLYDGVFALDGGTVFGIVPRVLWSAYAPPDVRNRVQLAVRPLLVRGVRTLLIDAGLGDKTDEKLRDRFGVERGRHLDHALAEAGVAPDEVDIVLATHLHFDHAGGFTMRDARGTVRPRFPRARYVVRRGEWDAATHPHARNRANYIPEDFLPLAEAGVLELVDQDQTIMPGVRVQRTGGHTADHQAIRLESGGKHAIYTGDVIPTVLHARDAWAMGLDLYPMDTMAAKQALREDAVAHETLVFFPHDPAVAAGYFQEHDGTATLRPIP
jgi:methylmalonyl-CoA epimerase